MRKATRSAFQIVPHSRSLQSVLPLHRYKAHKVFYHLAADDQADVPALEGWRREMFGEMALKLKRGEIALAFDGRQVVALEQPAKSKAAAE